MPSLDEEASPEIAGLADLCLIGEGGFARVYSARRGDDTVAVKVARRPHDPRAGAEAEALRLIGPPVVPALLGEGRAAAGQPYLVLELVRGESLAAWLAERAPRPAADEALAVLDAFAAAVDAIHALGVVHRDLKPANAILRDGAIVLLDLGLARAEQQPELTLTGQRLGTPTYMAPEQCLGARDVGPAADRYALAAIAYELLCGRPPFVGLRAEIEQGHAAHLPPRPSTIAALPPAVDEVLLRGLAKAPGRRPATCRELVRAIRAALSEPTPDRPAPDSPRAGRRRVALLAARSRAPVGRVGEIVALEHGQIARAASGWYVIAFPHAASATLGVRAALRAAGRLELLTEVCVVHTAELVARGALLAGAALSAPAGWLPPGEPPPGTRLLTAAAAETLGGDQARADEERAGFFVPLAGSPDPGPGTGRDVVLRGREPLLATLAGEVAAALRGAPTVALLLGETGAGKTRLIGRLAAEAPPGVPAISLAAGPELLAGLAAAAFDIVDRTPHAVERAVAARLGREDPLAARAVARALGIAAGDDDGFARAPGALRQTLASAIGQALRRRPCLVLLDDAHAADPTSLDALEAAALAEHGAPIFIGVAALPSLAAQRPAFGERAAKLARHAVGPLDDDAARALLRDLLRPAEFVPDASLARMLELSGRVPLHLVEVARALHAGGAIRLVPGTGSFLLAADDLLHVSSTPLAERLAARALSVLAPPLRRLAQLAAALGDPVEVGRVEAVQALLVIDGDGDGDGGDGGGGGAADGRGHDAAVGLAALERHELLRADGGGRWRFRHPLIRDVIEALAPPAERRAAHEAALRHALAAPPSVERTSRVARHAMACAARGPAIAALLELAERAAACHDDEEVEQRAGAALLLCEDRDGDLRLRALAARARARLRRQRLNEARRDLEDALALTRDDALAAELLLETATALDWSFDFAVSASAAGRAAALAAPLGDPRLLVRCRHALARSHLRHERLAEAITAYTEVEAAAAGLGNHETEVTALLLLAPALVMAGRLGEAERAFERVVDRCERAGDLVHLGGALGNRLMLWVSRQALERALDDVRRSCELARVVGNVHLEMAAQNNLGELLLWLGRPAEGQAAATRARELQLRHYERPGPDTTLLCARLAAELGDPGRALALLGGLGPLAPSQELLARMVALRCRDARLEEWAALVAEADPLPLPNERLEILLAAAVSGAGHGWGDLVEGVRALSADAPPSWARRFALTTASPPPAPDRS